MKVSLYIRLHLKPSLLLKCGWAFIHIISMVIVVISTLHVGYQIGLLLCILIHACYSFRRTVRNGMTEIFIVDEQLKLVVNNRVIDVDEVKDIFIHSCCCITKIRMQKRWCWITVFRDQLGVKDYSDWARWLRLSAMKVTSGTSTVSSGLLSV